MNETPSLIGTNLNGKIFVKVFDNDETNKDKVKWLNFNKKINMITAGPIVPQNERDILIVASDNVVIGFGKQFPEEMPTITGSCFTRKFSTG